MSSGFYCEAPVHYLTVKMIFQFDLLFIDLDLYLFVRGVKVSVVISKGKWRASNIFNMLAMD